MSLYVPSVREEWGVACTVCVSDECLQVELSTLADLTPDGTEPFGDLSRRQ